MSVELFPIDIGYYHHHRHLDVEAEVAEIAAALAGLGVSGVEHPWTVPMDERGHAAVVRRMRQWKERERKNTILYWVGHGSSDGDREAYLAHAESPDEIEEDAFEPKYLANRIRSWQLDASDSDWLFVVIDSCSSGTFVRQLHAHLTELPTDHHVVLLGTSKDNSTNLAGVSDALRKLLRNVFGAEATIRVEELAKELQRAVNGTCKVLELPDEAVLVRTETTLPGYQGSLEDREQLMQLIRELPEDARRHFLPKAQGGELSHDSLAEMTWYFTGRDQERRAAVRALERGGITVVTGRAGAGKSALLGDILVRSWPLLANFLMERGLLAQISDPPPSPFDAAIHLSGMSNEQVLAQLCEGLGHPFSAAHNLEEQLAAIEKAWNINAVPKRLLVDALDEAVDPIWAAGTLKRIAGLPKICLLVGSRRSTREGPDQPDTDDSTLLDALGPATVVVIERDPKSAKDYALMRLTKAQEHGFSPQDIDRAATSIAEVNQELLYVRLATYELLRRPELLCRGNVVTELGTTHRDLFSRAVDRLSAENPLFYPLLAGLAMAQGRGLPIRDGVWATIALAIAGDTEPTAEVDEAISQLIDDAARPYLALDREHDQTVYRLAHRTFVEHFTQDRERCRTWHQAIVTAAIASLEREYDAS